MKKIILLLFIGLTMPLLITSNAFSHCEVPCGIYGDEMRFDMIEEHIKTVGKSMKLIMDLSEEKDKNYNQIIRWVNNKENHANEIQHIVYQYFMTQRVKPVDEKNSEKYKKYVEKLTLLHKMLIYAMKSKQSTDLAHIEKLRSLLTRFKTTYLGPKK